MKYKNLLSLFIVLALFWLTAADANALNNTDSFNPAKRIIEKKILDNGMDILIQENKENKLVAFEVVIKTGSIFEGSRQGSGIAHLLEHMLFKGTKQRAVGKIEEEVKSFGGSINGYTSHELTGITLILPSRYFENGLDILNDMLRNPLFEEPELQKEKEVILSEIKMNNDDPERYMQRIFWRQAYTVAPFNLPVIGLEPLFLRLNRNDVISFYEKWYVPNNIIFSVAGDINTNDAFKKITEKFSDFPIKAYPELVLPDIAAIKGVIDYEEEFDIQTSYMIMGFPGVSLTHQDAATLDVIATIIGQTDTSRLYKQLVKLKNLAFSVDVYNYTPGFRGMFTVSCMLDAVNKEAVMSEVFLELEKLKKKILPQAELEKAKNQYLSDYIFQQETVEAQSHCAAWDEFYTSNAQFSREYLLSVARLTPADILNCSRKYFNRQDYVTTMLTPKGKTGDKTREVPPERQPIKKITLDSGLRILFRKNSSLPAVYLLACFGGGTRFENEVNNGTFNLLGAMLAKGTYKHSAEEISESIESMGGRINTFSGYNSFGLSMEVLSQNFKKSFDVFSDILLNSAFPENELQIQKRLALKQIQIQNDDIFQDTMNRLKENLFHKYPYRLTTIGTRSCVEKITRVNLQEAYSGSLSAENIVISVNGDIEEQLVIDAVKNKFGGLKKNIDRQILKFEEELRPRQLVLENKREKEQAVIMMGFPGCDIKNQDRITLEVLNSLLTSPGSLLYQRIREKYGLSYTLGGASVSGPDTGYFFIYAATVPGAADDIRKIINDEISSIRQGNIDEQLLKTTKSYLIGKHWVQLQANSQLSFTSALDELLGLGADYYSLYESELNQVNIKILQTAAEKYLNMDKSVIVITRKNSDV